MPRVHNFYAGPAALPLEVLQAAREELLDFQNSGVSVMETSHRSKEYDAVHNEAGQLFSELLGLGDNFKVLFLQGGASLQFAMIPMNLLSPEQNADYIITGAWSKKALKEAKLFGNAKVAGNTEVDGVFNSIPAADQLDLDPNAQYCHLTSNNTIFGTQWQTFPDTGNVPLVADMSSDILSRRFDPSPFGIIYAGAQKNIGPAGVAVVAIRDDVLDKCKKNGVPTMLSYHTHADKNSLFNTPPCFTIYMVNKVFNWLKNKGGIAAIEKKKKPAGQVLAIDDPRTSTRIDFIGGIRGTAELEKRCKNDAVVAFSMFPTGIEELMTIADAGQVMPPKSTWFEPKLRSGLIVKMLDE